jgi:hypothetical protein
MKFHLIVVGWVRFGDAERRVDTAPAAADAWRAPTSKL